MNFQQRMNAFEDACVTKPCVQQRVQTFEECVGANPKISQRVRAFEEARTKTRNIRERVKDLMGDEGLRAYKFSKVVTPDHVMHMSTENVRLGDLFRSNQLSKMDDAELVETLTVVNHVRMQYASFESGSTGRV